MDPPVHFWCFCRKAVEKVPGFRRLGPWDHHDSFTLKNLLKLVRTQFARDHIDNPFKSVTNKIILFGLILFVFILEKQTGYNATAAHEQKNPSFSLFISRQMPDKAQRIDFQKGNFVFSGQKVIGRILKRNCSQLLWFVIKSSCSKVYTLSDMV